MESVGAALSTGATVGMALVQMQSVNMAVSTGAMLGTAVSTNAISRYEQPFNKHFRDKSIISSDTIYLGIGMSINRYQLC